MTTTTPEMPDAAIKNLRDYQRQLDMDGSEVGVSRQALDEVLAYLTRPTPPAERHERRAESGSAAQETIAVRTDAQDKKGEWMDQECDCDLKKKLSIIASRQAAFEHSPLWFTVWDTGQKILTVALWLGFWFLFFGGFS